MIEEGFYKNSISQTIINNYLSNPKITNIDHLILACTHYPLIESEIEKYYNNRITIINSAKLVAKSVKSIIEKNHIQSNKDQSCDHEFFVSDYTSSFEQSTTYFFGKKINLKEHTL
jgi:glutamate racemase